MNDDQVRRTGTRLDVDRLDYELARRGLLPQDLARLVGTTDATVSKIRHGRPCSESTLAGITRVLLETPILQGRDLILSAPTARAVEVGTIAARVVTGR